MKSTPENKTAAACDDVTDMDRLESLFTQVSAEAPDFQPRLIAELCGDDLVLRKQLEELLDADRSSDSLLDHSLAPPPPTSSLGEEISGYRLQRVIGRGGMGVVYAAEQFQPIRRTVALKVIVPGFDTSEVLARFEAERQTLSLMEHPNIAKVLDAGTTSYGLPFFVMELVRGEPVSAFCADRRLSAESRLKLFVTVCRAIQHAHQKGIIHRDIKPSNVLVADYDGQVVAKVIDFGVAKAIDQPLAQVTGATRHGQVIGTLGYMSPEQSDGNQLDIDTRSDVYSLGVLLYELLTGAPPFSVDRPSSVSWEELLRSIREDNPPRPSTRLREQAEGAANTKEEKNSATALYRRVRGELDWVIMKAMEKDRNRRYATPADLANDIERFLQGEAVLACPPTRVYRLSKFAQRNKTALAAAALVAASLLAGLIGTTWQAVRASRAEKSAAASAAESRAANDFLVQDLLGLAGAESQISAGLRPDPNLKLDTLLDRAVTQLDARFDGQEQLRTDLKATLAHSFESIGRYQDAARLYSEVVQEFNRALGREHPDTLPHIRQLVRVQLELGKLVEAEDLCRQALESSRRILGGEHRVTLLLLDDLASIYHKRGGASLRDAERTHKACLEVKQRLFGDTHPEALDTKSRIAGVYESLGRFSEAEALHWEVLEAYRRTIPSEHPAIAAALHSIGRCRLRRGRSTGDQADFRSALQPLQSGFSTFLDVRGADHPNTLDAQADLAQVYSELRRFVDAEQLLTDLVDRLNRLRGVEHLSTIQTNNHLGCVYIAQLRLAEAECVLAGAHEAVQRALPDSPIERQLMNNLAVVYHQMGKLTDSIAIDEELLRLNLAGTPRATREAVAIRARLGMSYLDVAQEEQGRELLGRAFAPEVDSASAYVIAGVLAQSYFEAGSTKLATQWIDRQIEAARTTMPDGSLELADCLARCGRQLLTMQEPIRAERVLRESRSIHDDHSPESWDALCARSTLGEALLAQQKYEEAKPLLVESCRALIEQVSESDRGTDARLLTAVEAVIAVLKEVDLVDEVSAWERVRGRLLSAK